MPTVVPLLILSALAEGNFPDPAKLIADAILAEQAQAKKNLKFTWREDEERPKEKTKTYDVIMLEGENYRKLILIGSQPLDAKTEKKVEGELEKTRQERKHGRSIGFHKNIQGAGLEQVSRLFDSKVTGEETIDGRKAWRMESEPKPGTPWANAQEEEMLAARRITWFDEEAGVEVQNRTTYFRNIHQIQAGNEFDLQFGKVGDSWQVIAMNFQPNIKFMPGVHITSGVHYRYYDFKRFASDSNFIPE
jgi:hypothetical protein